MGTSSAETLVEGRRRGRGRRAWPAGLLGMLGLVGACERYVARHDSAFTTLNAAAWRRSGERLGEARSADVVGLGDSLVKHGFVPPLLAANHGLTGSNLALPGGRFPAHYALLRRLIEAGARPKAVLVDGEMLGEDPLAVGRVWSELATLRDSAELAREADDWSFLGRMAMARVLPSVKDRPEIRAALMAALDGKSLDEPQALPVYLRNWKRNGGAQLLPEPDLSKGDPRLAELEKADYRPEAWACHEVNARYAERLLALAGSHGVRVYWLLPPYHPDVQIRRERYGWYGHYVKYLQGMLARHPNLTVVDGRHAGYPAGALADMTHLSRTGALAFTDALGSVIVSNPKARWIALPGYEAGRADALAAASALEDVPGSGRALTRVMEGVREAKARGGRRAEAALIARLRRWPWGLIGMLALVAASERAFSAVEMDVLAPWHWDWRHTGKAATGASKGAEVLFFGDSLLKFGALPKVVEARGGGKGYNLAIGMGQAPSSYFLLRRALRSGRRPKAVVLDAAPDLLARSPTSDWSLRQWPELLGPSELLDLACSTRRPALLARLGLAGLLPTYRARLEIRAVLMEALRGGVNMRRGAAAQFWRNTRANRGASVMAGHPSAYDRSEAFARYFGGGAFRVDPVNAAYLERFLALADAEEVPVFWALTPVESESQAACERSGFAAGQASFVRGLQARHPGLTVVDARASSYGSSAFGGDPVHLNAPGATAFSDDLADAIRRRLDGVDRSRWVVLGAYRRRGVARDVEDMAASAEVIRRGGQARR